MFIVKQKLKLVIVDNVCPVTVNCYLGHAMRIFHVLPCV